MIYKKAVLVFSLTAVALLFTNASLFYNEITESQNLLSNEAWFSRCYSHITGTRVNLDHPLLAAVRSGAIQPVAACMSIFDKAMILQSTDKIGNTNDEEALNVLRVFFDFHKSWFTFNDFENKPEVYQGNLEFHYDASQESCFLTHALFSGTGVLNDGRYQNDYDYRNVVTSTSDVRCLRSQPTRIGVTRYDAAAYATLPTWSEAPGRGFLIGTKEQRPLRHHLVYSDWTAHYENELCWWRLS